MKLRVIIGLMLVMGALGLSPAVSANALEERVKQMEAQLAELKALVAEQKSEAEASKAATEELKATVAKQANAGSPAKEVSKGGTQLKFGGYIKVDGMYSDYDDGPRPGNIGDEILVPSLIPVGGQGESARFDSHIKTSRLFFKSSTDTDAGKINSHFEIDLLTGDGDERISNSAHSRIRHAFVSWDYADDASLLVGQSWSTFFNVGALPESVDFIGPTSGTIFNRQTQLRWTKKVGSGSFMLALENPSTSLADAGSGISESNIDDNSIPDIVARYNGKNGNHSWALSALGREIGIDSGLYDDSDFGVAVNLAGKYVFDNGDDLKYSIASGNLGRYMALNAFRDGGIDAAGNLDLTSVTGGYIAYRHHWSDKLRSTIQYALSTADLADGLASTNTEKIENYNVNLMYSPTKKMSFGGELISASRELENGEDGDLTRFQVTAKYVF